MLNRCFFVLMLGVLLITADQVNSSETAVLVLKGGTLIDGTGRAPLPGSLIVIRGNKIEAVLHEDAPIPRQARVIDTRGKTILPGLIDAHVHVGAGGGAIASPAEFAYDQVLKNLKGYLICGVTTVRSLTDSRDFILNLRAQERAGQIDSPRIFAAGPSFTAPGGHPTEIFRFSPNLLAWTVRQVDDPQAAAEAVDELAAVKVDVIKAIYDGGGYVEGFPTFPKLSLACLRTIIEQAHKKQLPVVVHTYSMKDVSEAVAAGADGVEHGVFDILLNRDSPLIQEMKARGVFYVPTLSVLEAFYGFLDHPEATNSRLIQQSTSPLIRSGFSRNQFLMVHPARFAAWFREHMHIAQSNLRLLSQAGIRIALGTDAGNPMVFHGPGVHRELELMVEAGLAPMDAIVSATKTASELLGVGRLQGTVEPGKLADLLIINGDPLKDISQTANIETVIKAGRLLNRAKLIAEVNDSR